MSVLAKMYSPYYHLLVWISGELRSAFEVGDGAPGGLALPLNGHGIS